MSGEKVVTKSDVAKAYTAASVKSGAVIVVHFAMKPIGKLENGPATLIEPLIDIVGPKGTIIMPTFTWYRMPENLSKPILQENSPIWTGKVPETFLSYPGVKRDRHPHWSQAYLGPLADYFIKVNESDLYGYGKDKVHYKIYEHGGSTMMVACDFASCSAMYPVHDIMDLPYRLSLKKRRGISVDTYMKMTPEEQYNAFDFEKEYYSYSTPTYAPNFAPIEVPLRAAGVLKEAPLGDSKVMHVSLEELYRVMRGEHKKNPDLLFTTKKFNTKLAKLAEDSKKGKV